MSTPAKSDERLRVLIAGGGVAALEAALGLHELAGERVQTTVLAPNAEFSYRPLSVREPFAYTAASHYPLEPIVSRAGARLLAGELAWVDAGARAAHTGEGAQIDYDALIVALGAIARPRYEHVITIDDSRMDETLHGLLQDIEGGYTRSLAFVSPPRMPWQLPMYELALMTAVRAYDSAADLKITIVTPEDSPLAIFGEAASDAVAQLLARRGIEVLTSAYAEIPRAKEIVLSPGDRRVSADRIVALPELYGPQVRGLALTEHGFIRVDAQMQVPDAGPVYAAGDAVDFPVKHGGLAAEQADVAAEHVAALAGADVAPGSFTPVIHGMLLTGDAPLYLTARITGGQGFSSEVSGTPPPSAAGKIAAKYLAPCLEELDRGAGGAGGVQSAER